MDRIIDINTRQPKLSIAYAAEFLDISVQAIHKNLKTKGIECPKIGNKTYITYATAKKLFGLTFPPKKIAIQIVKGGVGKTTCTDTLSSGANAFGARVLKIDADPQGNLTDAEGIDAEERPVLIDVVTGTAKIQDCVVSLCEGLDMIPSRIENVVLDNWIINNRLGLHTFFENILAPIEKNYDYIFIDCPPMMGQLVTCASLYSDIILAPLNPDRFSAKGLKILKEEIKNLNKSFKTDLNLKVFLNKFSSKTILSEKAVMTMISDPELEGHVLNTTIQFTQDIPNITDESKNIFSSLKKSVVRDEYIQLVRELLDINPK